jgi:hypothetical protein
MASVSLRDPKVLRLIVTGLLGAGAIYVFFATAYLPVNYPVASAKIKDLKADFEKKSNDLSRPSSRRSTSATRWPRSCSRPRRRCRACCAG